VPRKEKGGSKRNRQKNKTKKGTPGIVQSERRGTGGDSKKTTIHVPKRGRRIGNPPKKWEGI